MINAETKVFTAHVPQELAQKVDAFAALLDRSRGWILKQALNDWVMQEESRHKLTQDALADVDSGLVIAHEDVMVWAHSLGDGAAAQSK